MLRWSPVFLLLALLGFAVFSGYGVTDKLSDEALPVWTTESVALMRSLSLDAMPSQTSDQSNAFWNDPAAAALGHKLFDDERISANGKTACSSCHQPDRAYTDGLATALGQKTGFRNTPSIIGASNSRWFNWDGSVDSLWAQAIGPIEAPTELGFSRGQLVVLLRDDPTLRAEYEHVFGLLSQELLAEFPAIPCGPLAGNADAQKCWKEKSVAVQQQATRILVNFTKAMAAYQTTLQHRPSRFDQFARALASEDIQLAQDTLSIGEQRGLKLFLDIEKTKCINCHNGPTFSNGEMHDIGTSINSESELDLGQMLGSFLLENSEFRCDGIYSDALPDQCTKLRFLKKPGGGEGRGAYKVPTLRNLGYTEPFMHDGRFNTLLETLQYYNNPPLPNVAGAHELKALELSEDELRDIASFLLTLDAY